MSKPVKLFKYARVEIWCKDQEDPFIYYDVYFRAAQHSIIVDKKGEEESVHIFAREAVESWHLYGKPEITFS